MFLHLQLPSNPNPLLFCFPPPIQGCILVKPWFCYFDTVLPPRNVILYYKRVLKKSQKRHKVDIFIYRRQRLYCLLICTYNVSWLKAAKTGSGDEHSRKWKNNNLIFFPLFFLPNAIWSAKWLLFCEGWGFTFCVCACVCLFRCATASRVTNESCEYFFFLIVVLLVRIYQLFRNLLPTQLIFDPA